MTGEHLDHVLHSADREILEPVEALSRTAFAIAAVAQASGAIIELTEFLRYGAGHDLNITEVVEQMADALQCVLRATGRADDEAELLLAAVAKYLDGWA